ncbi:MAG: hypothetical protein R3F17_05455 [Planctomycetota bacterium]
MPLGQNCEAVPNTTGEPGRISATGSNSVGAGNFVLNAWNLPATAVGYFLNATAAAPALQPAGSMGNLCLGGSIGRFNRPGEVSLAGADGHIDLTVDLTAMPTPTGPATVSAGQTWHFTAWHRDFLAGQSTSNFTDGLSVTFEP